MKTKNINTILGILNNLHENPVDEIIIKQENYQYKIQHTGITNRIPDMYNCYIYDGTSYQDTTLNNIISCIQNIGFIEATINE